MKSKTLHNSVCILVRQLILSDHQTLSEIEINEMDNHLQVCDSCKKYSEFQMKLDENLNTLPDYDLIPDPKIKENLLQKMASKKKKRLIPADFYQGIRTLADYRIPVYQAALAVFLAFIVYFGVSTLSHSHIHYSAFSQEMISFADSSAIDLNIIENYNSLKDQNIGRNVAGDSILANFIVSSL
jgi:hypothetical protein